MNEIPGYFLDVSSEQAAELKARAIEQGVFLDEQPLADGRVRLHVSAPIT